MSNRNPGINEFRCHKCRKIYDTLDCSDEWDICIWCETKDKKLKGKQWLSKRRKA